MKKKFIPPTTNFDPAWERRSHREIAEKFRFLAQQVERDHEDNRNMHVSDFFTCHAVGFMMGADFRELYEEIFDFQRWRLDPELGGNPNSLDLWDQPDCWSLRVMLLCFAAALAETGDLGC